MKIILITAVSNLGKIGDIIEVKNGYAKNFLIPNKKAICFTENNYKIFESKKQEFEQNNQENLSLAEKVQAKIAGKEIIIIENASDDGRLYGSVNSSVIATKINKIVGEKSVIRSDIFLKKPIKEVGIYDVKLNLHSEVSFEIRLVVTRSESEAEALLKAEKKGNNKSVGQTEVVETSSETDEIHKKKPRKSRAKKSESSEAAA